MSGFLAALAPFQGYEDWHEFLDGQPQRLGWCSRALGGVAPAVCVGFAAAFRALAGAGHRLLQAAGAGSMRA
ncbi:hypothetical protein [Streptomyces naphthomycinicus]|uniref:hypothetical protein n=1 Tax=Streptomyces naphthomycinicus TaxID=2872625 RepID=UPI001CED2F40|nr:hypothetical protein [Streptomyces sp. TML10]